MIFTSIEIIKFRLVIEVNGARLIVAGMYYVTDIIVVALWPADLSDFSVEQLATFLSDKSFFAIGNPGL